jgi:hypothetical protein
MIKVQPLPVHKDFDKKISRRIVLFAQCHKTWTLGYFDSLELLLNSQWHRMTGIGEKEVVSQGKNQRVDR